MSESGDLTGSSRSQTTTAVHHHYHGFPLYSWYYPYFDYSHYSSRSSGSSNKSGENDSNFFLAILFVLFMLPMCLLLHFYTYCHSWSFFRGTFVLQALILTLLACKKKRYTKSDWVLLIALCCSLLSQLMAMIQPYYLLLAFLVTGLTVSGGYFVVLED
jgi:hypothetical protein